LCFRGKMGMGINGRNRKSAPAGSDMGIAVRNSISTSIGPADEAGCYVEIPKGKGLGLQGKKQEARTNTNAPKAITVTCESAYFEISKIS